MDTYKDGYMYPYIEGHTWIEEGYIHVCKDTLRGGKRLYTRKYPYM
jgi:hypothetical protein